MLYKPLPANLVPELVLKNWKVFEVTSNLWEGASRHFVGYNITEGYGRVSSEIKEFDKEQMLGKTRSGRIYKLQDASGEDSDALYVWEKWCAMNEVKEAKDVTEKYA